MNLMRENDFEDSTSEEAEKAEGLVEKALEFDMLHGYLESEVRELEAFLSLLQTEILSTLETVSSFKQLGEATKEMEDKLHDCEISLKQCFEQVSEIKVQSSKFKRVLGASSGDGQCKDDKEIAGLENGDLSDINAKIKMQTAEQQRNVLRMLEKSLAREIDLENKLNELRGVEQSLKLQLQQELFCLEVEAEDMWQRLFEAENSSEILLMISKDLFAKINGLTQRDDDSQSLKEKARALQASETSRIELVEKVSLLEQKLMEAESQLHLLKDTMEQNKELKEKAAKEEKRAEIAEAESKLHRESNMELNKDVNLLKNSLAEATERVERLEKQLVDSEIKRLHAEATAEASQEKQSMLECTVKDMDNLIKDLKLKVVKAEKLTESAEDKCIILSESNAELFEELNFLRHRVQNLEKSLHQADESKKGTAKDIMVRTKLIADLVMQLALERERLRNQISSLAVEKKTAMTYLQQMKDNSLTMAGNNSAKAREPLVSENDSENGTIREKSNEAMMGSSDASCETSSVHGELLTNEIKTGNGNSPSDLDTVRNIDVRQLNVKHIFIVSALVIPTLAVFLYMKLGTGEF
ncbi:WPP domain-interacting tail-anchored protein 1 isoform X2 [Andrographis paniculata]|uniref:WPP domain-interacting tail-anchored protein 1 isoform X2 n=1 Tax=Andrographis paniculata TaxID=175694 RepID=UPI0021E6E42F|nr:WPP domain-interacting tail-anchored protein 1 isoform X2 [Andrographis paniculata]